MKGTRGKRKLRLQRLELTALLCVLPFLVIVPRLAYVQLVEGDRLETKAEHQRIRRVWLPPARGDILDRHGERLAYSVLDTTESRRMRRVYPYGSRSSQVVGYVDWRDEGASGIELALEGELKGHPGWATQVRSGKLSDRYVLPERRRQGSIRGVDVTLTLDAALQDIAASELQDAVTSLKAAYGTVVAVDPRTGDVLAMAGYPSFDPHNVAGSKRENIRLRAITDAVEPGSTAKLIPALVALQDGLITPETILHCENGTHFVGGRIIEDHEPFELLTFKECFAHSSNIAFAKVGMNCGSERLYATARKLGFGSSTGICLDGESRGKVRPLDQWNPRFSPASVAIGYEIAVTPLQLTMAYGAIANNGVLMRPRLLKSLRDPEGHLVYESKPLAVGRIAEPREARILMDFFQETVEEGTGGLAALDWAQVGGKTGTARKIVNNSYSKNHHRATFVGIAPLDDPRLVITVMIEDPRTFHYGGSAAAPVVKKILETYARVEDAFVRPDYPEVVVNEKVPESLFGLLGPDVAWADYAERKSGTAFPAGGLPDVRGLSKRQALLEMGTRTVTTEGSGKVKKQVPAPGAKDVESVHLICGLE